MAMAPSNLPQLQSLSSEQRALLLAALESNKRNRATKVSSRDGKPVPSLVKESSGQQLVRSPLEDSMSRETSRSSKSGPATFGDGFIGGYFDSTPSYDVDFPATNGDSFDDYTTFPGDGSPNEDTTEFGESGEKRKSPDDDSSDDDETENGKRREGDDKTAKKPGRKLITTEPTTKRKAQNRAAQRAFRDRKEKHLKDLEVKVGDLEKVTETKSTENTALRAQIERLQTELKEYKKRISASGNAISTSPKANSLSSMYVGDSRLKGGVMSDFQFDFSRFGETPNDTVDVTSFGNNTVQAPLGSTHRHVSPHTQSSTSSTGSAYKSQGTMDPQFEPALFNSMGTMDYGLGDFNSPTDVPALAHSNSSRHPSQSQCASTAESPCSSTGLNAASSAGTSPEPVPNYSIENAKSFADLGFDSSSLFQNQFPGMGANQSLYDFSSVDWLSHQNGGQFEPQLFSDYRESQAAVVGDDAFNSGLFDEPYNFDDFTNTNTDFSNFSATNTANLSAPINTNTNSTINPTKTNNLASFSSPTSQVLPVKRADSLMDRVARCREGDTGHEPSMLVQEKPGMKASYYTTQKLWTELQSCPKFLSGDLDIDVLCSELSAKATCSETGMQVPTEVVEKVLWRLAGVPEGTSP